MIFSDLSLIRRRIRGVHVIALYKSTFTYLLTRSESKFSVDELNKSRFSTAIGWTRYVEDSDEYFSVFLVGAISATVPASMAAPST